LQGEKKSLQQTVRRLRKDSSSAPVADNNSLDARSLIDQATEAAIGSSASSIEPARTSGSSDATDHLGRALGHYGEFFTKVAGSLKDILSPAHAAQQAPAIAFLPGAPVPQPLFFQQQVPGASVHSQPAYFSPAPSQQHPAAQPAFHSQPAFFSPAPSQQHPTASQYYFPPQGL
jgi:hypothetical protein